MGGQGSHLGAQHGAISGRVRASGGDLGRGSEHAGAGRSGHRARVRRPAAGRPGGAGRVQGDRLRHQGRDRHGPERRAVPRRRRVQCRGRGRPGADAAETFYGKICQQVVRAASAREAEMAKLLENTYRHVNIALVNEMAIFCRELGVDLHDAIRCAATKPFGFAPFYPGPGVGGHCIPIDPNYLSYKVRTLGYPFRFVELAQEINAKMPAYVVDRAAELLNDNALAMKGARVLLLGVTYKKDVADQRESPASPLARKLRQRGAAVAYHDPYVPSWQVDGQDVPRAADLEAAVAAADLVILLQAHQDYDLPGIAAAARLLLDTRSALLRTSAASHIETL